MLGRDLQQALAGRDVTALGRADLDVTDAAAVAAAVRGHDVVLNCAAYTKVDEAEAHEPEAYAVNAVGAIEPRRRERRARRPARHDLDGLRVRREGHRRRTRRIARATRSTHTAAPRPRARNSRWSGTPTAPTWCARRGSTASTDRTSRARCCSWRRPRTPGPSSTTSSASPPGRQTSRSRSSHSSMPTLRPGSITARTPARRRGSTSHGRCSRTPGSTPNASRRRTAAPSCARRPALVLRAGPRRLGGCWPRTHATVA